MKIRIYGIELRANEWTKSSKILETKDWIAYADYGWQQLCEKTSTPVSNMIYLKHKDSGIFFAYALPLFKSYSVTDNIISCKTMTCTFEHDCCHSTDAEIKVSPHQDIPEDVVALHIKGNNIPAYNAIWATMEHTITKDEAKLCYPTKCEDYSFFDGIKSLTDKALGGIIKNRASFGVINNSQTMHYIMAKAIGPEPPCGAGASLIAYRCVDSFPCPHNRAIPPLSDEYTQYIFVTEPSCEAMIRKVREILGIKIIPPELILTLLLGGAVLLGGVAGLAIAVVTEHTG